MRVFWDWNHSSSHVQSVLNVIIVPFKFDIVALYSSVRQSVLYSIISLSIENSNYHSSYLTSDESSLYSYN
jgi:hypothetical protein